MQAQQHYIRHGWAVFTPITPDSRADFIAMCPRTGRILKVQVKTVQDNKVGGIVYRQCRLMPNNNPYKEYEVDVFLLVYPPTSEMWMGYYKDIGQQKSINLGRADEKGRAPKNKDKLIQLH